ncbi:MAG: hypothetical protein A2Z77_06415 [Chloroflexi bacterium RBG_13_51_36]|nr:MAG: hypothetical protein A2Z77_06415 [Chloroflexi bacterium RBG_13_51_36]
MKLNNKPTRAAFARSPWLKLGSLVGACLLLVAALVGVGSAFSLPSRTEQPIVVANYAHRGTFDYLVYLKPNSLYGSSQPQEEETEEETSPVFFRNIIEETRLIFSYNFSCGEALSSISNEVVIAAVAENPGMWQKQITILEETHQEQEFEVDFPLDLGALESVVDDIEKEIGLSSYQNQFTIRATVHTTAETSAGQTIEDDFSHEITAVAQAYTLQFEGSFRSSDTGSKDGVSYREEGWFDYEVYLEPNMLYETDVLRSNTVPAAEPSSPSQTLGPGLVYFPNIVDSIEAGFSYQFLSDKPATNLVEEVEVTALLEYPGMWSKSFTLVPETSESGPLVVYFPVDINMFNAVTNTLRSELGFGAASYDLTIKATVHTTADLDSQHVDQVFTHSLQGQLGMTTLTLKGDLSKQQPGTVVEYRTVPIGKTWVFRALALVGLTLTVLGLLFVLRNRREAQTVPASGIEEEALRVKKKHKGVIVDVGELPPARIEEAVIPVGSVNELVGIADALLKPVLHRAEVDKHTYCILDGGVRYVYVSQA